ncbi:MAG: tetratricopeptide repeat protein [Saprospiraceae bacterium]|nr:tetratricopeptide repeat protein [Saprospiraceae bacterium]
MCVGIASCLATNGNFDGAIELQKKSLSIMQLLQPDVNHHYFGNILSNIARLFREKGDYANALKYYLQIKDRGRTI